MLKNGLDERVATTVGDELRTRYAFPGNRTNLTVKRAGAGKMTVTPNASGYPVPLGSASFDYTIIDLNEVTKKWGDFRIPAGVYHEQIDLFRAIEQYNSLYLEPNDIEMPEFPKLIDEDHPFTWSPTQSSVRFKGYAKLATFRPARATIEYTVDRGGAVTKPTDQFNVACTVSVDEPNGDDYVVMVEGTMYTGAFVKFTKVNNDFWRVWVNVKKELPGGRITIIVDSKNPLGTGFAIETKSRTNFTNVTTYPIASIDEITQNGVCDPRLGFINTTKGTVDCGISESVFANNELPVNISYLFANASITSISPNVFRSIEIHDGVGCFQGSGLTSIPNRLFGNVVVKGDFHNFAKDSKLEYVYPDFFNSDARITSMAGFFQGCSKISSVPATTFMHSGSTLLSVASALDGTGISEIPETLLKNLVVLESVASLFTRTKVTVIPPGLLSDCVELKDASDLFARLEVASIPMDIFANNNKLESTSGCFDSTKETTLTEELFSNHPALKDVSRMFRGAVELVTVPNGLFKNAPNVTNMENFLADCWNVYPFPVGLFDYAHNVTNMDYVCSYVGKDAYAKNGVTIEFTKDITKNWGNVESASRAFIHCSFHGIGKGAFDTFTKVTQVDNFFGGESWSAGGAPIQYVPEDLFVNCHKLTRFHAFFAYSRMSEIPPKLFTNMPNKENVSVMTGIFYGCPTLKTVPVDLFKGFKNVRQIDRMFGGNVGIDRIGIEEVPIGFFESMGGPFITAAGLFSTSHIKSIDPALIARLGGIERLDNMWAGCEELEVLEEGILSIFTRAISAVGTFANCKSLKEVKGPLMDPTKSKLGNVSSFFQNCESLKEAYPIASGLSYQAFNLDSVYEGCTAITELKPGITKGLNLISSMKRMFYGCLNISKVSSGALEHASTTRIDCNDLFAYALTADAVIEPNCVWVGSNYDFTNAFSQGFNVGGGFQQDISILTDAMYTMVPEPKPTMKNMCCVRSLSGTSNDNVHGNSKPFMEKMGLNPTTYTSVFGKSSKVTSE